MIKQYIEPNEFDRSGTEMKYHNTMDKKRRGIGAKTKTRPETVVIRDSKTGKVYGRRTLVQKSTESVEMKFLASLLANRLMEDNADITTLPQQVIGEIKKNIRKGANDLEQEWANALELVHKAYQVANVRRPSPDQKGAWRQYEELIQFAVRELYKTRGINGKWRMTSTVVREQYESSSKEQHIGKRRFFVDVPGAGSVEVNGESLDDIIDQVTNKMRRHGAKVRIDERREKYAILSIWVDDVKRDSLTIKEIS